MTPTQGGIPRAYLALLAVAGVVAAIALAFAAALADSTSAAPAVAPNNTSEPRISGTTRVGEVLRTNRGTWTGTPPISYEFRWYRCDGAGQPDASDCGRISNANNNAYQLRAADAGFRIRSQVVARNADGQDTATSNPTAAITSAAPANTEPPTISGTASVGNRLTASPGEWVGVRPITYAFQWLRCNAQGESCAQIRDATDNVYTVVDADVDRTLRVNVTAENARGRSSRRSAQTAVVGGQQPPPTGSIPVGDLRAAGDRLVVASVSFSPNPVTSRTAPITARVRVTARSGRPVVGALVFMRATPRVVQGQTVETQSDGVAALTLIPNQQFPQPRSGFNVQFFVKAYRRGDPELGGIAGYRLVQVRLAG
jgi:hypothetical protein